MGWEEAFDEECELSQSTDREVAEALESRSDSCAEDDAQASGACGASTSTFAGQDDSSLVAAPRGLALWWVQKLLLACGSLRSQPFQMASSSAKLSVISGCTGCSAEAAVLQAG